MLHVFYLKIDELDSLIKQCYPGNLAGLAQEYKLPAKSLHKILSYHQRIDQLRSLASEIFKYKVLAKLLKLTPVHIQIEEDKYYRPYLNISEPRNIDFNLSHSGNYVVMVVSNMSRVGIDIEYIEHTIDYMHLKPITFSEKEQVLIQSSDDFFNLWTKKESLIKAAGKGFLDDMHKNTKLNYDTQQTYSYNKVNYQFQAIDLDNLYKIYICYVINTHVQEISIKKIDLD